MNYELLVGLVVFALVSSLTPGPNNLMLMASGANYGFRRTLPHMLGVSSGFTLMVLLVGVGVLQIFERFPSAYQILKVVSICYLLFLAWKIASAKGGSEEASVGGKPITYIQAVLFQWVNPKAWTMALTAVSVYSSSQSVTAMAFVAAVFGAVNLPCISLWTSLGLALQGLLSTPVRLRSFNLLMGGLLVASLYPVLQLGGG